MILGQTNIQRSRRSWSESRVGRILAFVAITWAIAGAFMLLQEALPALLDSAVKRGWVPDALVMPNSSSAKIDCRAAIVSARLSTPDPRVSAHARGLVWLIGLDTGFAAGIASSTAGSRQPVDSVALLARARQLSELIGVEPPALPAIQHAADALHEFEVFVATDPHCIAAQIGEKYSARQAALYKFAVIAGHAAVYRIFATRLGPVFVPELRSYGYAAEVPDELWKPLVEDSIEAVPGADAQSKIGFVLERIGGHLKANP